VKRSPMNRPLIAAVGLVAASLIGCNGPLLRVTPNMGDLHAVATSADVRLVLTKPVDPADGDYVKPKTITCAEPSPDMARIVTEALGASSSLSVQGKMPSSPTPAQLNATMALSKAHAEAIAQMTERLATIQLLRDALYRACEAYANGAISSTTYAVILSRFDKMTVTMLFGELAAGNFGRPLATLTGTAASKAEADLLFPTTTTTTTVPPTTSTTVSPAASTTTTTPSVTTSTIPPSASAASLSGICFDPSECDTTPTTLPPEGTTTTTLPPAAPPTTAPPAATPVTPPAAGAGPNQQSKTQAKATTAATPAGEISKFSADAAEKIAGHLLQMQANYLNDQNADALKVACLSSLGREEPIRKGAAVEERPEKVITYDEHGCPRRHTVYRYQYTRALSVFCDELLQSLGRNEALVLRYNMRRGLPVTGSLAGFIAAGSKNAIGPLTPVPPKPDPPMKGSIEPQPHGPCPP
jgi:hypothetical protein